MVETATTVYLWTPFPQVYGNRRWGRWKNVVVWGEEWQEEADEQQEEAEEEQQPGYINSHWKVDHKGTMVFVKDRKGIY